MKNQKKKAFTLAELLVVVLIVGVLASVAVPKMKSTIETRRTSEAEDIMTAVRTEQEKRCVLGKQYLMDSSKVDALANASNSTNYSYALDSTGIVAQSKGKDYNLQIRSYKTGEICCQGEYCASLNKNYPSCDSIAALTDECAGVAPSEPTPEPEIPTPTPEPESPCAGPKPEDYETSCGPCGRQTISFKCIDTNGQGNWTWVSFSQGCVIPEGYSNACTPGSTGTQSCENNGTQTRTCSEKCAWGEWSACEYCAPTNGETYTERCPNGKSGQYTYTWDYASCRYKKSGACTCTPTNDGKSSYTENCTGGKVGVIVYEWNNSTCSYTKTDNCSCPNGKRADGSCKEAKTTYKYELKSISAVDVPACRTSYDNGSNPPNDPGLCATGITASNCYSFRTPQGATITYPGTTISCGSKTCGESTYPYTCIAEAKAWLNVKQWTCHYSVSQCQRVSTTTWE